MAMPLFKGVNVKLLIVDDEAGIRKIITINARHARNRYMSIMIIMIILGQMQFYGFYFTILFGEGTFFSFNIYILEYS